MKAQSEPFNVMLRTGVDYSYFIGMIGASNLKLSFSM